MEIRAALKELLKEHVVLAAAIFFDTLLVIFMLFCFYLIDIVVYYCGFQNEFFTEVLHTIIHPVALLVFFIIFIINILRDHLPRTAGESRYAIVNENDVETVGESNNS